MPIANDIWLEQLRPNEAQSIVASFNLHAQPQGDPSSVGLPFIMSVQGIGDLVFGFVCCLKGQAIYSASLADQVSDQGQTPEHAELVCSEFLRAFP